MLTNCLSNFSDEYLNMCEFNPCDSESLHMQAFIKVYFDPTKVWIFETSQDIEYWFKNTIRDGGSTAP